MPAPEDRTLYTGPAPYALADWRRRVSDIYASARIEPDPRVAWQEWTAARSRLYARHPLSPLPAAARARFAGLALFDYDRALRFSVDLEPAEGDALHFDLGTDGRMSCRPIARTRGLAVAMAAELPLYWIEGYGGGVFLPFGDATNGAETYGGGRYLIDAIKGADPGLDGDGRLILDFNFAYTPSCAWNDAYVCPLPPVQNRLRVAIRAGEKLPASRL